MVIGQHIFIGTKPCVYCGHGGFVEVDRDEWCYYKFDESQPLIQHALSNTMEEREQIITGTHPQCLPPEPEE